MVRDELRNPDPQNLFIALDETGSRIVEAPVGTDSQMEIVAVHPEPLGELLDLRNQATTELCNLELRLDKTDLTHSEIAQIVAKSTVRSTNPNMDRFS